MINRQKSKGQKTDFAVILMLPSNVSDWWVQLRTQSPFSSNVSHVNFEFRNRSYSNSATSQKTTVQEFQLYTSTHPPLPSSVFLGVHWWPTSKTKIIKSNKASTTCYGNHQFTKCSTIYHRLNHKGIHNRPFSLLLLQFSQRLSNCLCHSTNTNKIIKVCKRK